MIGPVPATPDIAELVRAIIAGGESYYAEFKSAFTYGPEGKEPRDIREAAKDIGEASVAFANSDGGDLLVGVEDSGNVTGVPWDGDKLGYLVTAPKTQVKDVDLGVVVHEVALDGHRVLLFRVPEYPGAAVVTASGRCLWRRGTATEPVPPAEIERRRRHRLGDTSYEAAPIPEATLEDIEIPWDSLPARAHLSRYVEKRDVESLLRYWNLIERRNGTVVLRRAALLLFARDALRWHPNNRLRIRRVYGSGEGYGRDLRTREQDVRGPILAILRNAPRILHVGARVDSRQEALFATSQLLPDDAVDECIVNAVAHRNYAIEGSAIEIHIYPDRLEFLSPGKLPEPLTIDDLRQRTGAHRSRNPLIMRVLRDLGWSRDQGEGMRRIFGAMSQVELHEPELEVRADTFIVRLSTRSVYDDQTQAWIGAYGPFGLRPEERKYVVALRQAGGVLSVDRLARQLNESFDETKNALIALEDKGIVWHAHKSRTYHVVEPLEVFQERAFRQLENEVKLSATTELDQEAIARLFQQPDARSTATLVERFREGGVLAPAGKGKWRLGKSILEYARKRIASGD
jgi:ATP-dependent DNA helicase RecG